MRLYITLILIQLHLLSAGQQKPDLKWWSPGQAGFAVIDGRAWQENSASLFDRLPEKAKQTVRPEVWNLSKNSAGEYIQFTSNATEIVVRYKVTGGLSMPHMPATGVSGVDLYALDINNNWHWAKGNYNFGDTITYTFSNLFNSIPIKEYRLYLPLYNTPTWLNIAVDSSKQFSPIAVHNNPPVVLYGTSIMQGACASRPGLAWSNILGRKLNLPIVNLGFSGNGRLETALIDLLTEIDARLYVLDCQPNLVDRKVFTAGEIQNRIRNAVKNLQNKHPETPVLLVEHCCGLPAVNMDTAMVNTYTWTSNILAETFAVMKANGTKNIYLMKSTDIGFDAESTVDGTHPNDIGMMKYADAYEKVIRSILHVKKSK